MGFLAETGGSVLIAGVGGQGTLLASKVIGNVAIARGFDVKVSEVHGMSQRGGSVVTYVKFATGSVHSPIIGYGRADVLMAFEQLEAYRNISYVKNGGAVLMNTQRINPMPVISGAAAYPEDIAGKIESLLGVARLFRMDALGAALDAGSAKAVNMVLTGMLARIMDGPGQSREDWHNVIAGSVPSRLSAVNIAAFEAGFAHAGRANGGDNKEGFHE